MLALWKSKGFLENVFSLDRDSSVGLSLFSFEIAIFKKFFRTKYSNDNHHSHITYIHPEHICVLVI
jgi:hypothetical protein